MPQHNLAWLSHLKLECGQRDCLRLNIGKGRQRFCRKTAGVRYENMSWLLFYLSIWKARSLNLYLLAEVRRKNSSSPKKEAGEIHGIIERWVRESAPKLRQLPSESKKGTHKPSLAKFPVGPETKKAKSDPLNLTIDKIILYSGWNQIVRIKAFTHHDKI